MSRADLWAFAGIVAVQRGIDNNNAFCGNFQKDSEYVDDLPVMIEKIALSMRILNHFLKLGEAIVQLLTNKLLVIIEI